MEGLAAWLLEAMGPLGILAAQVLHAGMVFLKPALPADGVPRLAALLEDPDESHSFAAYLRGDVP